MSQVNEKALRAADRFLTAYLSEKIADADFSEGSVTRDHTIGAIAHIFAYLEKERALVRDTQSLHKLQRITDPDISTTDIDEAADAILSNWFITRNRGQTSHVTAVLHFTQATAVTILPTTRFFRTRNQIYTIPQSTPYVVNAGDLLPRVDAGGAITTYTLTLVLQAATAGTSGNVRPGRFVSADPFNAFFTYAENLTDGIDGKDTETTTELLKRAETAPTVRNLVNVRSIDAVLQDRFANLKYVYAVGMGAPEMVRDLVYEEATNLRMHLGGHTDIYVNLGRSDVTETLTVGQMYPRPDNVATILRDASTDFVALGVRKGDVLRITAGLPGITTVRDYLIQTVEDGLLETYTRTPFPVATDELGSNVEYSVGRLGPTFSDLVAPTTGQTSRSVGTPGAVTLIGRPQYRISSVEVLTTPPVSLDTRINTGTPDANAGEYMVVTRNPADGQSAKAVTHIHVPLVYDGESLRVTYETLAGYSDIQTYVTDPYERVMVANPLVKGLHPVYVSANLVLRLKKSATATVSALAVQRTVSEYINDLHAEVLEVSGLLEHVREAHTDIGVVLHPFELTYELLAPDGQVYSYLTRDIVTLRPRFEHNTALLQNGATLRSSIDSTSWGVLLRSHLTGGLLPGNVTYLRAFENTLDAQLNVLGVSDNTVRYLSSPDLITVTVL